MGKLIYIKNGEKIEESFTDICIEDYIEEADELVKQDYTVILSYNNIFNVDLAKSFVEEDYNSLMDAISTYTKEEQDEMVITNHVIRNGLEDTDIYDYGHIKYILSKHKDNYSDEHYNEIIENRKPIKVLDIFTRQRFGKLTPDEEEMYSKYINFDLDFLLFSDSDTVVLNTDNGGFITIFDDCTLKNTNTTDAHDETHQKQQNWYMKTHHCNSNSEVKIYIFKENMALFIPDNINEYQEKELSSIIEEVDDLSKFHNKDVTINAAIVNSNMEPLEEISGLKELKEKYVTNKKSKDK